MANPLNRHLMNAGFNNHKIQGMMKMTICTRAEYLERTGINTEIICAGCDETGCRALNELDAIVKNAMVRPGISD